MARRSGLGRGLGALIPTEPERPTPGSGEGSDLRDIPVSAIRANRFQPRQDFDDAALADLAASVAEVGVLQPVLVRPLPPGSGAGFELIAGERRWRAAQRVGLTTIPALVRDVDDLASMEQAVVENLHRRDLNPLEEAAAYQQLLADFGLTHEALAKRVGKSRTAVTNLLRLFQLPPTVQRLVRDGHLTEGHARATLATPTAAEVEALARRVVDEGLSVRATEEAARQLAGGGQSSAAPGASPEPADAGAPTPPSGPSPSGRAPGQTKEPGLLELEQLLGDLLATRVLVDLGASKGRVVIEFADLDDLERIYRAMTGA